MKLSATQKSAISRLFSSAVLRALASKGKSPLFARLIGEAGEALRSSSAANVGDIFDLALGLLQAGDYRDEYVYRAALTHRVLLGTHSLNTACMLNEFRVGECKADVAILNGSATVYEIKSERDSLSRLAKQLKEYERVFSRVFVIAGENHVESVTNSTDASVGVLCLSKRLHISTVREASFVPERVCPVTILDSVRTEEAKLILRRLGACVPDVPNTRMRDELRRRFSFLDPSATHAAMVATLKNTRDLRPLGDLIKNIPAALQAAALSIPFKKHEHGRFVAALQTSLPEAMSWA